ncbi:IS21 family transposase [bacterium]|nr:IS21 family transposase [bacterium]
MESRKVYLFQRLPDKQDMTGKQFESAFAPEATPKYGTVNKRSSKLDPYKDYIGLRLKEAPQISNRRILREIKKNEYTGSRSILGEFIKPLREERQKEATIRFETMPGEQSQVDWSFFGTIQDYGINKRLYCFSMVLGFSRTLYIEFATSCDIFGFIRCHQNAFLYFGGYTRTILYDNVKTVVLSRCEGNIEWNRKFMDFAGFYGFCPRLCQPYRARTKGKVERPFSYIRQDFFIGTKFEDMEDLNQKASGWLNTLANRRTHGTTKELPFERLKRENLLPLKDRLYDTSFAGQRKVSSDCFISYEGNQYSVPYQHSRRNVTIRADKERIRIYVPGQSEPAAAHLVFKGKGKDISEPKHFEGLKIKQRQRWQDFKESFLCLSPLSKDYWDGFLASARTRSRWWELRKKVEYERLKENLEKLKLTRILEVLDSHNRLAQEREISYTDYLDGLIQEEAAFRADRGTRSRIRFAHFPFIKTIEQFDFSFQPTLNKRKVEELFTLKFIDNQENVLFLGPPGVGKTHLSIALSSKGLLSRLQGLLWHPFRYDRQAACLFG